MFGVPGIGPDGPWRVDDAARRVTQALKLEPRIMRYELTDYEWAAIRPFLPNKAWRTLCMKFVILAKT